MARLVVSQVRSSNGANPRHRDTLRTLGLGRIGRTAEHEDSPPVRGALRAVAHLVEVEEKG